MELYTVASLICSAFFTQHNYFEVHYEYCGEKAMAPHSSTLDWKVPWMEEPGRLQSMGSLRIGHDWATSLSLFTFMHWRRKWQPTPVFLPGESQDGGAWWAAVYGVAQSRTHWSDLAAAAAWVLWFRGAQRVRHDWVTDLIWYDEYCVYRFCCFIVFLYTNVRIYTYW